MNSAEFWKNFRLGEELSVSGTFIYNGLRRFHETRKLDHADELFEVFYNLAVGLERLLKIAIVLLEHRETDDQASFEESLVSHNHQSLMDRVRKLATFNLGPPHKDFLNLLARFYREMRYGRFSLDSVTDFDRERRELCEYLSRHIPGVSFPADPGVFGIENNDRYKQFLRQVVVKLSVGLYEIVRTRATELTLFTGELRHGSKAETVFLGKADIPGEERLWKELLIFFMNTKESSGYLTHLRGIEPLEFDPGLVDEYLDCFQSDAAKAYVIGELETHYADLPNLTERLRGIDVIGAANVDFSNLEEEEDDDEDWELNPPAEEWPQ